MPTRYVSISRTGARCWSITPICAVLTTKTMSVAISRPSFAAICPRAAVTISTPYASPISMMIIAKDSVNFSGLRTRCAIRTLRGFEIEELWVPAAAITEENLDGDAWLVRAEARHRLKEGKGIRVFSRPAHLKEWMDKNGLDFESRKHLIVDAGTLVPGYTKDGVGQAEFFVHSPFGWRQDQQTVLDRNECSVVMQVTFREGGRDTYALLGSDVDHESISAIVQITRQHKNEDRLLWDLMKLFHHCSYLSLGPERGTEETKAIDDVKWLFETQGREGAIIVSPSWPFPSKGRRKTMTCSRHTGRRQIIIGAYQQLERPIHRHDGATFKIAAGTPFGFEVTAFGIAAIIAAPMVSSYAAASTPRAG